MDEHTLEHRFADDTISVQCTYRPGCIVDMVVTVLPNASEAAFQKAIREIRKEVSLPGFRQGHVPNDIVMKNFGSQIDRRFRELCLMTAFDDAVKLVGRAPFAKNSLRKATPRSLSRENGGEIAYEYEASPVVPPIDMEQLHLEPVQPKLPTDEEVEHVVDWLCFSKAEQKPAEGRTPKDGDGIEVELSRNAEGPFESKRLYCRQGVLPEWLYDTVLGMNLGDIKETTMPIQGNAPASQVFVKLVQVFDCALPELNDAFATSVGEPSVDVLRHNIRARLEYDAHQSAQERMRRQVRNELIRLYAFDLPQSLVENETESRFQNYWKMLTQKEESSSLDKETVRKPFLEEVKRHLTCLMLLQQLFDKVQPTYTMRELTEELRTQTTKVPPAQCVIHGQLEEKEVYNRLLSNIVIKQCEDYCIQQRLGITPPKLEATGAAAEPSPGVPHDCCHEEGCHCHEE